MIWGFNLLENGVYSDNFTSTLKSQQYLWFTLGKFTLRRNIYFDTNGKEGEAFAFDSKEIPR